MRYVLAVTFGLMFWGVLMQLHEPVLSLLGLYWMGLAVRKLVRAFAHDPDY